MPFLKDNFLTLAPVRN